MIWATTTFLIHFLEIVKPKIVDYRIYHPDRIIFHNIFIKTLRKKVSFVWDCSPKSVTL